MQAPAHDNGIFAVIPIKRLDNAKSRLANVLTPAERASLALTLATHTLSALKALHATGALARIAIVSPDPDVLVWAEQNGATGLRQTSAGLNAGLSLARDWATEQRADGLLIALGDLPLLSGEELRRMLAMTRLYDQVVALAPDRFDDGTNLLLARPAALAPLAYGRGSFARHQRLARQRGISTVVFRAPGAAFDVDTPADLYELITRGLWQREQSTDALNQREL